MAASPEWNRLYGSLLAHDPPDFSERRFTPTRYPELHSTLIEQFTAPFFGTSIVREHSAPTMFGDVVVRSHWKAVTEEENPRWDRIVIIDLDVTDLRMAQHDLEVLLSDKQRMVESKDQLIASVSHEIRTPLSSIVGFAHLRTLSNRAKRDDRTRCPAGMVPSLGLGLHISRFLARRMGGDVSYRYEDGSVFELTLPLAADT